MVFEGFLYFGLGDENVSDATSETLFRIACWMRDWRVRSCVMSVNGEEMTITTRFRYGSIGGFWGMLFFATVESEAVEQEIEFVISDSAQGNEKGVFASSDDLPESEISCERHDAYRWN